MSLRILKYPLFFLTSNQRRASVWLLATLTLGPVHGQDGGRFLTVDQFGYLPDARKVCVIRDPRTGFDSGEAYVPGKYFSVVRARTGEPVYRGAVNAWKAGAVDGSSGDAAWHFDFSSVREPGTYYILDEERDTRSFEFRIAHDVYNEVLRQAMRTFFYQRSGHPKESPYADPGWTDGASHLGPGQDTECRSFFDKSNPDTERDVSGGWYDAGDYNKYTSWTADYVIQLMLAYRERPQAWGDDYRIPESGNGIPDILDEAKWGLDHLLRMQNDNGSVLSIVGAAHASPPSAATGPSYYGKVNTSATLSTAAALALASVVCDSAGMDGYADTLRQQALKAWDWAEANPAVLFNNNSPAYNSVGLGAGRQEMDDYGRKMTRLEAACFLFEATGETRFRDHFDAHYSESHLMQWNWAYPFESHTYDFLLHYTTLPGGTPSVQEDILSTYRSTILNSPENMAAYTRMTDPYRAYIKDYTWGSNNIHARQGHMHYHLINFGLDGGVENLVREASESYIHYLHGTNPLSFVYLSNMYNYGAERGVNEFYHSWFSNGSSLWDRVGTSTYGPAPGYLTGGPNPSYDWDGCCPSGCGSASNNRICTSESITPPKGQPAQKSYKDFNTSWPLNSWSVTENSCGYQVSYIRLLSKFVTAGTDCHGDVDGTAFIDSCGICAGGNTGIVPSLDPDACAPVPPPGEGDTMFVDGRHLYTAAGEKVVLRGVNEMFVWSGDQSGQFTLPQIDRTGANCVRLVWAAGEASVDTLVRLIENCIDRRMIAMPECHSATGSWEDLDLCINFWNQPALIEGIRRNRRWTLLNIGNEVGDGSVTPEQFREGYSAAIDSLRKWGYTVPLVIDASNWGQSVDVIFGTWKDLQAHDPLHNILFSVHSYWSDAGNYDRVASESVNGGLPIIIGEGPSPTKYPDCGTLDYGRGLEVTAWNDIGWLSWSWGTLPNGHCVPLFDHTHDGVFGRWRTPAAEDMMVSHPYSLMRTAQRPASFYPGDTVRVSGIYLGSLPEIAFVGEQLYPEVLIAPSNAGNRGYTLRISGDTGSVVTDPVTGALSARRAGTVQLEVTSAEDTSLSYVRDLEVREVAVSGITIIPSTADLSVGDTLLLEVDVQPPDATVKEVAWEVMDNAPAIRFDSSARRVVAISPGTAQVIAEWVNGGVSDTLTVTVSPVVAANTRKPSSLEIWPNPAGDYLHVRSAREEDMQLKITDLCGKVVREERISGGTSMDIGMLAAGHYLVVCITERGVATSRLLIL